MHAKKHLWVMGGPTASGKTTRAIELASHLNTEIISFDSRQFFREIPIGTAAPSTEEMKGIKHHFIRHLSVQDAYSAGQFAEDADIVTKSLFQDHDHIVAVGGSGLYLKAWLHGLDTIPDVKESTREKVREDYALKGLEWLQSTVKKTDPILFERMDQHNPQRLMRAIEIYRETGKPLSAFQQAEAKSWPFDIHYLGLSIPREILYNRINARVDAMMEAGLENEAKLVLPWREKNTLQTVGYKELFAYFDGKMTRNEAISLIKQNTRRYAKRQLTWFKNQMNLDWFTEEEWPVFLEKSINTHK